MKSGAGGGDGRVATSVFGDKIKASENGDITVKYGTTGSGGGGKLRK
jgi:hypothetical protein